MNLIAGLEVRSRSYVFRYRRLARKGPTLRTTDSSVGRPNANVRFGAVRCAFRPSADTGERQRQVNTHLRSSKHGVTQ
jgi:hypothetical protein